uniref:Putative ovule protein n=1 Tax=Solanum chacoense TaxID=4108 RepID=A0A0V0I695_SOLCH
MLIRHPELFYVSKKGQRDSVFLVEGYDDRGKLLERDEMLVMKDHLMELVRKGKQMRRETRKGFAKGDVNEYFNQTGDDGEVNDDDYFEHYDGLDKLFEVEDFNSGNGTDDADDDGYFDFDDGSDRDESTKLWAIQDETQFWTTEVHTGGDSAPW